MIMATMVCDYVTYLKRISSGPIKMGRKFSLLNKLGSI